MNSAPFIRKAARADITRLKEIRSAVAENILTNPDLVTDKDYEWFIESGLLWVWDENDTIKGFAAGDSRKGWIWALFVDPVYEGMGIGRILFSYACQDLCNAGFKEIFLSTDENSRAATFYRAAGWQQVKKLNENEAVYRLETHKL